MKTPDMLEAALEYAKLGWKVFPVSGSKMPFKGTHGHLDATADPDTLRQFWTAFPNANIAIATGSGSGLTVIDIDDEKAAALVLEFFPTPPTLTATTGRGRHLYYADSTGVTSENKPFGDDTGIDVKSNGGYVVAPPSLHASGKRYAWEEGQGPQDTDPERLPEAWEAWGMALPGASKGKADTGQQRTADAPIPEGSRYKTLVSMAGSMRRAGLDAAAILAALEATNAARCLPPLPAPEVEKIAKGIGAKPTPDTAGAEAEAEAEGEAIFERWQEQSKNGGLLDVDLSDLGRVPFTPPEFIIDQIVPAGVVTLLGGHGGAGKSSLALAWAGHVACGQSWAGLDCRQGRALYVSLEDDGDLVKYRLQEIAKAYKLDLAAIREHLAIVDGADVDASLSIENLKTGQWAATPVFQRIEERAAGAAFIIVDNASDAFSGNEIARREVRLFIRLLGTLARREKAGLVLLAHIDKAGVKAGKDNKENYSGSTAWHNSVRSRLSLTADKNEKVTLAHEKSNLGPKMKPGIELAFDGAALVPEGMAVDTSGIFDSLDTGALLAIMGKAIAQGATLNTSRNGSGSFYTCIKNYGLPKGWTSKTVYAALDRLLESGQVALESYRENYKDRTRYVIAAENPPNPPNPPDDGIGGLSGQAERRPPNPPNGVGGMGEREEKKEALEPAELKDELTGPPPEPEPKAPTIADLEARLPTATGQERSALLYQIDDLRNARTVNPALRPDEIF